jgi:hypothetical protein
LASKARRESKQESKQARRASNGVDLAAAVANSGRRARQLSKKEEKTSEKSKQARRATGEGLAVAVAGNPRRAVKGEGR